MKFSKIDDLDIFSVVAVQSKLMLLFAKLQQSKNLIEHATKQWPRGV